MTTAYANRVRCLTATTGTVSVVLGAAVAGYLTPTQAAILSGSAVGYGLEDGNAWETGQGVLTFAAGVWTCTRVLVEQSSNLNQKITLTGNGTWFLTITAGQFQALQGVIDTIANGGWPKGDLTPQQTSPKCGILIPAYWYPGDPRVAGPTLTTQLLDLIRKYKDVPVCVIINPANGPGETSPPPAVGSGVYVWDGNYAAYIKQLKAAGASVVGYVSTAFGGPLKAVPTDALRTEAEVKADILAWQTVYGDLTTPGHYTPIDGIFFDEMSYELGAGNLLVALYQRYYTYAKSLGFSLIVGNPGANQQETWYSSDPLAADIIVTWETGTWPPIRAPNIWAPTFPGAHSDYDYRFNSVLAYAQPVFDVQRFRKLRKHIKWLYVTDDVLSPNPWDTMSAYIEDMFAACDDTSVPGNGINMLGNVESITRSGTTATLTTISPHGYSNGASVTIAGAVQTQYNGTFTITLIDPYSFSYTVAGSPVTPATTLTYITALGATLAWDASELKTAMATLTQSTTIAAPTGLIDGRHYYLVAKQDATGSRNLNFNAVFKFPSTVSLPVTTTANKRHVFEFIYHDAVLSNVAMSVI